MYRGFNKIEINVLCHHCRNKNTGVRNLTVEQLYHAFYTAPEFADKRDNHQMINSMIIHTLLGQHDCTRCVDEMYAFG
jgi:hypothetical protein